MSDENSFNESELDNIMNEIESLENELKEEGPEVKEESVARVEEPSEESSSEIETSDAAESIETEIPESVEEIVAPVQEVQENLEKLPEEEAERVAILKPNNTSQKTIKLALDQLEDVQVVLSINGQEVVFNLESQKSEIKIELEGGGSVNLPLSTIKKFAA